jgi:hypothetical protein
MKDAASRRFIIGIAILIVAVSALVQGLAAWRAHHDGSMEAGICTPAGVARSTDQPYGGALPFLRPHIH